MSTSEVTGVSGASVDSIGTAAEYGIERIARVVLSGDREDFVDRMIAGAKRHPLTAVVVGLVTGLAALAITDRLTRKW